MMTQQIIALPSYFKKLPSNYTKASHYRPTSETPFKWRFASGPIVGRACMLARFGCCVRYGHSSYICNCRPVRYLGSSQNPLRDAISMKLR